MRTELQAAMTLFCVHTYPVHITMATRRPHKYNEVTAVALLARIRGN